MMKWVVRPSITLATLVTVPPPSSHRLARRERDQVGHRADGGVGERQPEDRAHRVDEHAADEEVQVVRRRLAQVVVLAVDQQARQVLVEVAEDRESSAGSAVKKMPHGEGRACPSG